MANTQDSKESNYSFVVSSDPASSSDSPLRLENPNLPKQKRRRTSPRDHTILEAAYLRNSKPDKHERAEIVRQVELGEKEVQIWFQNRRQNDRRKSKPLQPHELLAHFRNGTPIQAGPLGVTDDENQSPNISSVQISALDVPRPSSRSSSIHELLNPASSTRSSSSQDEKPKQALVAGPLPTPPSSFETAKQSIESAVYQSSDRSASIPNTGTAHSRKRSHEIMADQQQSRAKLVSDHEPTGPSQPKTLSRSSSFVRLAMTVDGAVKIRTNDEPTPSPPKRRPSPPVGSAKKRESFGRSQSAIETGFSFKDINPPIRKIGRAGFGRSRDARTWEFYCDRDSGDALSTQAEAERSGSAIGAINLIRSRSQRNKNAALSPNPVKQNSRRAVPDQQHGKSKFSRTMSSLARLETLDSTDDTDDRVSKRTKHERSPSGDSDKENWAPGTRTSHHHMRRMHPSAPRDSVLQENDFPSARDPIRAIIGQGQENRDVNGKDKAKGDDLDCIQGLLSLSQGAWQ